MHKLKIGIIAGSTRPGRKALDVASWVLETAGTDDTVACSVVDLAAFDLPLLDEPLPPRFVAMMGAEYQNEHSKKWSAEIAQYDAFVFVTPEYNFGLPAALKNALDYLYKEWNNKVAGIVSYGSTGGSRSSAQLRLSLCELQVPSVSAEVNLSLYTDFENFTTFVPAPGRDELVKTMMQQIIAWAQPLKELRAA